MRLHPRAVPLTCFLALECLLIGSALVLYPGWSATARLVPILTLAPPLVWGIGWLACGLALILSFRWPLAGMAANVALASLWMGWATGYLAVFIAAPTNPILAITLGEFALIHLGVAVAPLER